MAKQAKAKSEPSPYDFDGPWIYENWKRQIDDHPDLIAFECPLFSDGYIVGQISKDYGPYQILNTVPATGRDFEPAMVLRISNYISTSFESAHIRHSSDTKQWYGISPVDELTSLLSLLLGV